MLKKILIIVPLAIVALLAVVLIAAAFQPDSFSMERSATLNVPPAALFEQVNDHTSSKNGTRFPKVTKVLDTLSRVSIPA